MPNVLNWIGVQAFRRGPPPVDTMLIKKGLCTSRGVFGIIVLHKTMVWQSLIDEWNQCPQECCNTDRPAYSLENIDFHGAHPADASPDTNLERVLGFGFLFAGLSTFRLHVWRN